MFVWRGGTEDERTLRVHPTASNAKPNALAANCAAEPGGGDGGEIKRKERQRKRKERERERER